MNEINVYELNRRVQNLFRTLQNDAKSIFHKTNKLSKTILNKVKKTNYDKNKVFVNLYEQLEDKFFLKKDENLPLITPFVDKKTNIDHSTLHSIHKLFELLHAAIADLRFLAKSTVDPKYCLLIVDLFTSKI